MGMGNNNNNNNKKLKRRTKLTRTKAPRSLSKKLFIYVYHDVRRLPFANLVLSANKKVNQFFFLFINVFSSLFVYKPYIYIYIYSVFIFILTHLNFFFLIERIKKMNFPILFFFFSYANFALSVVTMVTTTTEQSS